MKIILKIELSGQNTMTMLKIEAALPTLTALFRPIRLILYNLMLGMVVKNVYLGFLWLPFE